MRKAIGRGYSRGEMDCNQEELLALLHQLKLLAERPCSTKGTFERIEAIVRTLQKSTSVPAIAAQALDVQFKAEDIFRCEHIMPEPVLREMLADRLHRLEAAIRVNAVSVVSIALESRDSRRFAPI